MLRAAAPEPPAAADVAAETALEAAEAAPEAPEAAEPEAPEGRAEPEAEPEGAADEAPAAPPAPLGAADDSEADSEASADDEVSVMAAESTDSELEGEGAAEEAEPEGAAEAEPEAPPPWPAQRVCWRARAACSWSAQVLWMSAKVQRERETRSQETHERMHWRAASAKPGAEQTQPRSVTPEQPDWVAPVPAHWRIQGLMALGSILEVWSAAVVTRAWAKVGANWRGAQGCARVGVTSRVLAVKVVVRRFTEPPQTPVCRHQPE